MTLANRQLRAALAEATPARSNKYGARRTACAHGHTHDSAREARRCDQLHLLARADAITDLELQRFFPFGIDGRELRYASGRRVGVTIDFVYREGGRLVAEDSKGHRVRDWPLRRALFEALYPDVEVRET